MTTFQRRRDGRRLHEPSEAEDLYNQECDRALEHHFAMADAEEALREHLADWLAGEARLKVGMHSAMCLRKGDDDCVCSGGEATVWVQDPADRLSDPVCDSPRWAEVPR